MKKLISVLLIVSMILAVIPLTALPSFAASDVSGSIYLDQTLNINCTKTGKWDVKTFVPTEDGTYIFSSSGSYDTLGYIALAEGEASTDDMFDDGGSGGNFACTYEMKRGVTYYLGSTIIGKNVGVYTIKITRFEANSGVIEEFTSSNVVNKYPKSVTISNKNGIEFCTYTPTISGTYTFYATGSYDTYGYVFDKYWRQLAYDSNSGTGLNYKITIDLQAGEQYYFGYETSSDSRITFNIYMYRTRSITKVEAVSQPDKTDYIKRVECDELGEDLYQVDINLIGFEFKIYYGTGEYANMSYSMYSKIRGFSCSTSYQLSGGAHNIPFSYMGKEGTFEINVIDNPVSEVSIVKLPDNVNYYHEFGVETDNGSGSVVTLYNISIKNMIIRVDYKDGTYENIKFTDEYGVNVDYFDYKDSKHAVELNHGENTITLYYMEKEINFTVYLKYNSLNWEYDVSENGDYIILTKYVGSDTEAFVPETLQDLPVKEIGASCFEGNKDIIGVVLTNNITKIGARAFFGCENITELTISQSVEEIGNQAFFGMKGVEKINWDAVSVNDFTSSSQVFAYLGANSESGARVEFGGTCNRIPAYCLNMNNKTYAANVAELLIGENVTEIGDNAFRYLANLNKIEWNAISVSTTSSTLWLNSAADGADVYFEESVSAIPNNLFYRSSVKGTPVLNNIYIYGRETVIGTGAFRNCTGTFYCYYQTPADYALADFNVEYLDYRLTSISITQYPNQLVYTAGDEYSLAGLTVYAAFEDGNILNVSDEIIVDDSAVDMMNQGVYTFTISYTFIDKTVIAQFDITVGEPILNEVSISRLPDKTEFTVGDSFDYSGLVVTAYYSNNTTVDVDQSDSKAFKITAPGMSTEGVKSIRITCVVDGQMFNLYYDITVKPVVVIYSICDLNKDGVVDIADLQIIIDPFNFGSATDEAFNKKADVNSDGLIDVSDISILLSAKYYGVSQG